MKPALRKELFERYKEIGSRLMFNQFIWALECCYTHILIDGTGEIGVYDLSSWNIYEIKKHIKPYEHI